MNAILNFPPAKAATLEELLEQRIAAKRDEDVAAEIRRGIDAAISEMLYPRLAESGKERGSVTEKAGNGLKVSVTYGITRSVNADLLKAEWEKLPADIQAVFRWKPEVDAKRFDAVDGNQARTLARFVTTKDASPGIKIEVA